MAGEGESSSIPKADKPASSASASADTPTISVDPATAPTLSPSGPTQLLAHSDAGHDEELWRLSQLL
jgi:hypothetical protein